MSAAQRERERNRALWALHRLAAKKEDLEVRLRLVEAEIERVKQGLPDVGDRLFHFSNRVQR